MHDTPVIELRRVWTFLEPLTPFYIQRNQDPTDLERWWQYKMRASPGWIPNHLVKTIPSNNSQSTPLHRSAPVIGQMIKRIRRPAMLLAIAASTFGAMPARAETSQVRLAKQVGLGSLTLLVMEHEKLLEKQLRTAGLPDTKVSWSLFSSGAVMNDGLLSGNLDFATAGAIPLAVLWSKTAGTAMEVKGVCGVNAMPMLLDTRNPDIKSVSDFTPKSKIALPAIKVSIQAVVLQMLQRSNGATRTMPGSIH